MIDEAVAHGLKINVAMRNHLVLGQPRVGGRNTYVAPDALGPLNDSMTPPWRLLEWLPKSMKWNEWPRNSLLGYYIPASEPRLIADSQVKPRVHSSAVERKKMLATYKPPNFPSEFILEP
jgi:hypothetical protein